MFLYHDLIIMMLSFKTDFQGYQVNILQTSLQLVKLILYLISSMLIFFFLNQYSVYFDYANFLSSKYL